MTTIKRSGMCGNSPKNQLVEELAIALILGDKEKLEQWLTEQATIQLVGDHSSNNGQAGAAAVAGVEQIAIEHAISHGKIGAASGTWTTSDGGTVAFSDHYEFASAKGTQVSSVACYRIPV
ncbi:hypothetical protein [Paenibacillus daejeonensis]|uniref:hypothetical protein n=1 Tax=Paenibacillus daejeonensis TaxID=135193 RepID=UPI00035CE11A|nr:hypothetical protein [Paenibacillus daejeonensis]